MATKDKPSLQSYLDNQLMMERKEMAHDGVDPLSQEALPWYASRTRVDTAGIFMTLGSIETYLRFIMYALFAIAALLGVIAFR